MRPPGDNGTGRDSAMDASSGTLNNDIQARSTLSLGSFRVEAPPHRPKSRSDTLSDGSSNSSKLGSGIWSPRTDAARVRSQSAGWPIAASLTSEVVEVARGNRRTVGISAACARDLSTTPAFSPQQRLSVHGATLNLVTTAVGVGVVTLPEAVGNAGLVGGLFILISCGVLTSKMLTLLCSCASMAERRGASVQSHADVGHAALGYLARPFCMATVNLFLFGACCILMLMLGSSVGNGFFGPLLEMSGYEKEYLDSKEWVWFLLAFVLFLPTSWLRDMTAIAEYTKLGVLGAAVTCFLLAVCQLWYGMNGNFGVNRLFPEDFPTFVDSVIKVLFSFSCLFAVPTLRKDMERPEDMPEAGEKAMAVITGIYVLVSLPFALTSANQKIPSDCLEALVCDGDQAFCTRVLFRMGIALCLSVNLILSYPIVLNIVINAVGQVFPVILSTECPSLIMRSLLVFVTYIVGSSVKSLGALVTLLASITLPFTMMWFNIIFYWALLWKQELCAETTTWSDAMSLAIGAAGKGQFSRGIQRAIFHMGVFIIGAITLVVGLPSAVGTLWKEMCASLCGTALGGICGGGCQSLTSTAAPAQSTTSPVFALFAQ
eukprot:TRINITY_DN19708_c0_g1_i1.p1 TRINITY_DN19708_c0_g1~~TRINITY_DN19708_c0_g1_i1.p1  ORF type:complete len:602 (+),score=98.58 TRINITY_DN19708_c0_g1_i1:149-1954(+)